MRRDGGLPYKREEEEDGDEAEEGEEGEEGDFLRLVVVVRARVVSRGHGQRHGPSQAHVSPTPAYTALFSFFIIIIGLIWALLGAFGNIMSKKKKKILIFVLLLINKMVKYILLHKNKMVKYTG